jgi:membrane-associated phospholipid phosphatase
LRHAPPTQGDSDAPRHHLQAPSAILHNRLGLHNVRGEPSSQQIKLTRPSGIALIGYGFYKQGPNQHAFSLTDPTISFPEHTETVTTTTLILVGLFAPAVLIFLISWILVPATASRNDRSKPPAAQYIRRKFWEWNAGWMGLALALASAWTATQGLKVLVGKPRPDLLARCNPDLSRIAEFTIGGLGDKVRGAATLVSWEICRDQSNSLRMDGFASFPSGHSSCMSTSTVIYSKC